MCAARYLSALAAISILGSTPGLACTPLPPPPPPPAKLQGESDQAYTARIKQMKEEATAKGQARWRADMLKIEQGYWERAKTIGLYRIVARQKTPPKNPHNYDILTTLKPIKVVRGSGDKSIIVRAYDIYPPCGSSMGGYLPYGKIGDVVALFSDVPDPKSDQVGWIIYRKDAFDKQTMALFAAVKTKKAK
jgi:hypothetical protein